MKEQRKFNFKINVTPNGQEKYMSFSINNKLAFHFNLHTFQFLHSSSYNLVKNLIKDDFKYLSQEFDTGVLELVKKEGFYPSDYMSGFEKFKKQFPQQ